MKAQAMQIKLFETKYLIIESFSKTYCSILHLVIKIFTKVFKKNYLLCKDWTILGSIPYIKL